MLALGDLIRRTLDFKDTFTYLMCEKHSIIEVVISERSFWRFYHDLRDKLSPLEAASVVDIDVEGGFEFVGVKFTREGTSVRFEKYAKAVKVIHDTLAFNRRNGYPTGVEWIKMMETFEAFEREVKFGPQVHESGSSNGNDGR